MKWAPRIHRANTTVIVVLLFAGCYPPNQPPYVTREPPYVVFLQFPYKNGERVLEITVQEEFGADTGCLLHTDRSVLRWHMKAARPIVARDLKLTIGEVPSGFTQVFPVNGEHFVPLDGSIYTIAIKTSNRGVSYCCWWAPKPKLKEHL